MELAFYSFLQQINETNHIAPRMQLTHVVRGESARKGKWGSIEGSSFLQMLLTHSFDKLR